MILKRYGGPKKSKPETLQVVREINSSIPPQETEAAKVLRANVVDTVICLGEDRAVVSRSEQRPLRPQELPPPPPRPWSDQGNHEQKGKAFSDRIWRWSEVAIRAAICFREARKMGYESGNNQAGTKPLWALAKDWWEYLRIAMSRAMSYSGDFD